MKQTYRIAIAAAAATGILGGAGATAVVVTHASARHTLTVPVARTEPVDPYAGQRADLASAQAALQTQTERLARDRATTKRAIDRATVARRQAVAAAKAKAAQATAAAEAAAARRAAAPVTVHAAGRPSTASVRQAVTRRRTTIATHPRIRPAVTRPAVNHDSDDGDEGGTDD